MVKLDKKIIAFLGLSAILMFPACVRKIKARQLADVSMGMSKQELRNELGEPSTIRGAMINAFDQTIETWEYMVDEGFNSKKLAAMTQSGYFAAKYCYNDAYWFFFCNNKLVKWCKAGDWETTQHEIKEIRFR
jgi:hypothetical protein